MGIKISHIVVVVSVACLITALYFVISTKEPVELDSGHHLVMGTFARVVAVAEDSKTAKKCIRAALAEIHKVDELMSDYKSDSQISLVNRDAFKQAVEVSELTYSRALGRFVSFGGKRTSCPQRRANRPGQAESRF